MGHEGIHFNFGLCFIENEGCFLLTLEFAQTYTGTKILPRDVLFELILINVETQPVGHVVCEDHAQPNVSSLMRCSVDASETTEPFPRGRALLADLQACLLWLL